MKFYTNNFIKYIYKQMYCWLLLITGLNLKSKSFTTYRVTLYVCSFTYKVSDLHMNVSHTRGHNYKLYKPHSTGIRSNFFCVRVINVWNSLPAEVNFNIINTFKRSLHCVDFSSFLRRYSL